MRPAVCIERVIPGVQEGRAGGLTQVFGAARKRRRVRVVCNLLAAYEGSCLAAAFVAAAFAPEDAQAAAAPRREVADQSPPKQLERAAMTDEAKSDVRAAIDLPAVRRAGLHATKPLDRRNGAGKRHTDVVAIVPNAAEVTRTATSVREALALMAARWQTVRQRRVHPALAGMRVVLVGSAPLAVPMLGGSGPALTR